MNLIWVVLSTSISPRYRSKRGDTCTVGDNKKPALCLTKFSTTEATK